MRPARYPPPLAAGDRVGIAAISGPVDPQRLEAGLEAVHSLGFEPVLASNVTQRWAVFAGTDDERLAGLHQLAADPSIKAIFFARGGHGALRLLPQIDWPALGKIPRAWVGYSDLTPFLLAVAARLGVVAFHGPMVAADLARGLSVPEQDSLVAALTGEPQTLAVEGFLRHGVARGVLAGGCLSLLSNLVGTRWLPSLRGTILMVEDVGEPAYRVDRMLTHLSLSGSLRGVRGFAFGHLDGPEMSDWPASWLGQRALALDGPIAVGLPSGHRSPNCTLPFGAVVSLDPVRGVLEIGGARTTRNR